MPTETSSPKRQFITGPAGTGKTSKGIAHLLALLEQGVPPYHILVLVPQRTLGQPYAEALQDHPALVSGQVDIITPDSLALRSINLLWPHLAEPAGFGQPAKPPIFLTIETAQYYMTQVLEPLLQRGFFDPNVVPLTITPSRLMSQLLDNLEKAAMIGLPHTQVGERLTHSLNPEISARVGYEHAQEAIIAFRQFCLRHNLLDFSLRLETFRDHIWAVPDLRSILTTRYQYLIVDNLEEHNPHTHHLLAEWLPEAKSARLIFDEDAGYRIFLGASWRTAEALQTHCTHTERLSQSQVATADIISLGHALNVSLRATTPGHLDPVPPPPDVLDLREPDPRRAFTFEQTRFHPQMLTWAIDQIAYLVEEKGVSPNEIVVLAPFVSDTLRFSFTNQMERRNLPARSHRPSRALKEEPPALALLTLARLIHPHWNMLPDAFDVMQALRLVLGELDLVRARLLVDVLYRPMDKENGPLAPFEAIEGPVRERITYQVGHRFDTLRAWLQTAAETEPAPLDHTFSRLFGELLTQPEYGFHQSPESGEVVANLVESIRKFRRVTSQVPRRQPAPKDSPSPEATWVLPTLDELNREYVRMIEQGVVAALYTRSWESSPSEAVLIAPAYTFLMSNRPVQYQIWLDAGSHGWWERIAQPLTHPYILAADWEADHIWNDEDEIRMQIDRLNRLLLGLTRRCREHIFIANAEISEQGYEQRGRLLLALQQTLRRLERQLGPKSEVA